MAGLQAKGGKKNRKYGRNSKFCEMYRKQGRRERNRKTRWLRVLKFGLYMNRVLALRLHAEYGTKFDRGPHAHDTGPYVPEGVVVSDGMRKRWKRA